MIFMWLARQIELAAERSFDSASAGDDRLATLIQVHPRAWSIVHRLADGVAQFLLSIWFLFVWGFISSLIAYVTLLLISKRNSRSLSEITRNTDSDPDAASA